MLWIMSTWFTPPSAPEGRRGVAEKGHRIARIE
jgi:hypothetical protein